MKKLQIKIKTFLILAIIFCLPFFFIKIKYRWASLNLVEILILALFLVWIFNRKTKYKIQDTRYYIPIILIIVGLVLSILTNKNYYIGLGILKGWFVLPIIFAIVLYDNLRRDERLLDKIFIVLFVSGTFVAIEGIYYWLFGLITYDGRLRIFFDSPNQLAMFLAPAFLVGLKFGFEELRVQVSKGKAELWKKILVIAGIVTIMFNLYLTKSYSAWLAIAATLGVIFWLKYGKITAKKYFTIFFIILMIFVGWTVFSKLKNIQSLGNRSSLASREMIWKSASLMVEKNPIFGIGPGNFQGTYLEYQKYFPPYLEWSAPQPHNIFLAFWLESGLLGLAGFVWLLVLFFRGNKKTRQWQGSLEAARKRNFEASLICFAIILYFLIHGLVDTTYWRNDMAVIFWTVMAINMYLAGSVDPSSRHSG
jgi:O-antigen ligase